MELQPGLMCNVKIQRDDMPSAPALPPAFTQGKVGSSPSPAELPTRTSLAEPSSTGCGLAFTYLCRPLCRFE